MKVVTGAFVSIETELCVPWITTRICVLTVEVAVLAASVVFGPRLPCDDTFSAMNEIGCRSAVDYPEVVSGRSLGVVGQAPPTILYCSSMSILKVKSS